MKKINKNAKKIPATVTQLRGFNLSKSSLLRSTYGTGLSTCATINTCIGIDLELAITLCDCACRTTLCTSTTADAVFTNLISHFNFLLQKL